MSRQECNITHIDNFYLRLYYWRGSPGPEHSHLSVLLPQVSGRAVGGGGREATPRRTCCTVPTAGCYLEIREGEIDTNGLNAA